MFTSKEFRGIARNKLSGHWGRSILVTLVAGLLGGIPGSSGSSGAGAGAGGAGGSGAASGVQGDPNALQNVLDSFSQSPVLMGIFVSVITVLALIALVMYFVGAAVELGHDQYYIDLCTNRDPAFGVLFSRFSIFVKALLLRLYTSLFVLLWTLLFIIPGIIAAYRYAMAPYIMAQDPSVGVVEAVARSKEMMKGRKWRLFCLGLSFIGWAILCLFTLGIGFLWLQPYMQASMAAFYLDASGQGIPMEPAV